MFHNYGISSGIKYQLTPTLKTNINAGYVLRAPAINELYSSGLHQGVSGIEEGQRDLHPEKSLKLIFSLDGSIEKKLFFQALTYFQRIQDYIFLQPQQEFRLTIRGAFPVYTYQQTDAAIYGADLLLSYEPKDNIKIITKYAWVEGQDLSQDLPLINIPAANLFGSISYSLRDFNSFHENTLSVNGRSVFQQKNLLPEQDFLPPPDGYFLLGLEARTKLKFEESSLAFSLQVTNALNQTYRDYLNRLRYFSDDVGVDVVLRIGFEF